MGFGIRNLFIQNEQYEEWATSAQNKVSNAIVRMHDIDIRGSFEADDEVGAVFLDLKDAVNELRQILSKEPEFENQEKGFIT